LHIPSETGKSTVITEDRLSEKRENLVIMSDWNAAGDCNQRNFLNANN